MRLLLPPRRYRNDVIARSPTESDDEAIPSIILLEFLSHFQDLIITKAILNFATAFKA